MQCQTILQAKEPVVTIPQADFGPAAAAHEIQEVTEQENEEKWMDKYREATPCDAPLLSENKQFICEAAYPSVLEVHSNLFSVTFFPRKVERKRGSMFFANSTS